MPNTAHEVRWCGRGVDRLARAANFASKFEDVSERKAMIAYAKAATIITRGCCIYRAPGRKVFATNLPQGISG